MSDMFPGLSDHLWFYCENVYVLIDSMAASLSDTSICARLLGCSSRGKLLHTSLTMNIVDKASCFPFSLFIILRWTFLYRFS